LPYVFPSQPTTGWYRWVQASGLTSHVPVPPHAKSVAQNSPAAHSAAFVQGFSRAAAGCGPVAHDALDTATRIIAMNGLNLTA